MQMGRKEWYAFKKEMAPRYVKFHEALAAGDGHALRSLMTEPGYNVRMLDVQRRECSLMRWIVAHRPGARIILISDSRRL